MKLVIVVKKNNVILNVEQNLLVYLGGLFTYLTMLEQNVFNIHYP